MTLTDIEKMHGMLYGLGFSESTARVYTAMLQLGPNSVQNIAKAASLSRQATYDLIAALKKRGLVSTFEKGRKTFYSIEDPMFLDDYFRDRMVDVNARLVELRQAMPVLRGLYAREDSRVRYYNEEEGVRALFRDVINVGAKELLEVVNVDSVYKNLDKNIFLKLRASEEFQKIYVRAIVQGNPKNPGKNANIRFFSLENFPFSGNLWIYADRVAFVNPHGSIDAVIVESPVFSQMMRAMFEMLWQGAKNRN